VQDLDLMRAVADAYAWHRSLGNESFAGPLCRFVKNPERPEVWSSNHVSQVRASSDAEIDAVLDEMEQQFDYCPYRFASIDCFTPQRFVARLAMDDYRELSPTLQMVLTQDLGAIEVPALVLSEASSDSDWKAVYDLVAADHAEGARTNRALVSEAVTRGIVAGLRKKSGPSRLFVAHLEGRPCAYGVAATCPNGLGMVEDLFTLPRDRGRGIASGIIAHCVRTLRQDGIRTIFLGAHVTERPKYLYRKLGFAPLMVTREFVLDRQGSAG
jgi:GNAT superfamily N-acetyltransferase